MTAPKYESFSVPTSLPESLQHLHKGVSQYQRLLSGLCLLPSKYLENREKTVEIQWHSLRVRFPSLSLCIWTRWISASIFLAVSFNPKPGYFPADLITLFCFVPHCLFEFKWFAASFHPSVSSGYLQSSLVSLTQMKAPTQQNNT